MKLVIEHSTLRWLIDMAKGHIEDIESGVEEGYYSASDNPNLAIKKQALLDAEQILNPLGKVTS